MAERKPSAHKLAELDKMSVLIGRRITRVSYDDVNDYNQPIEGVYELFFEDGGSVSFSSSGDDMTFTSMSIEPPPGRKEKYGVTKRAGKLLPFEVRSLSRKSCLFAGAWHKCVVYAMSRNAGSVHREASRMARKADKEFRV